MKHRIYRIRRCQFVRDWKANCIHKSVWTCRLKQLESAAFLRCDSSRMRKNTKASSMAMALAMSPWMKGAVGCRGSPRQKLVSQKIHVHHGGLRNFCKSEPLRFVFCGVEVSQQLSEPSNLNFTQLKLQYPGVPKDG